MEFIIRTLVKSIGWEKLLLMAWNAAYPALKKRAISSVGDFDDAALSILNQMIVDLTGAPKDVKKPAELMN